MANKNDFTDRERQLMAFAWQCFNGEPKVRRTTIHHSTVRLITDTLQVDYKKLAELAGMGNPVSASNAWSKIKKKIQAQAVEGGATTSAEGTPKPTKATPNKNRVNAKTDQDDDESPVKKAKGGKGSKNKKAASEEAENDGSPVKEEAEEDGGEF